jgi:hypothetical protein
MNWGKWIIVAFVLFAGFIATLVTVCMRQDVNLVSKDYYKEELAYQNQIVRINNARGLEQKPEIKFTGDLLEISFARFNELNHGEVKLFRPSSPDMDRTFKLKNSSENIQRFNISGIQEGMYKVKVTWTMGGKEYYIENIIYK